MKINKKVKNIIGVLLSAIILYFIIVRFCKYWPEISPFLQNANWVYMLVGIIIVSIGIGIIAFIWQIVFKDLYKINLPFYQCLSIIFLPNIARYIPGKFWFIFGTVFLAKRWKLDVSATIVVSIIAQLFFLLGGIWVGFIASLLGKMEITTLILLPAVLFGILIFFLPSIFYKILNIILNLVGKGKNYAIPNSMTSKTVLLGTLIGMVMWIIIGFGVMISIKSVFPDFSLEYFINITGAYSLSYAVGYFSLITPAGLGIREGAMIYLLPKTILDAQKTFFVLATRVWMMLSEFILLIFIIILLLLKGEFRNLRRNPDE